MLGWRSAERIEILNVCRFLAKDGQILKTTDVLYSLEDEIGSNWRPLLPSLTLEFFSLTERSSAS